MAVVVLGRRVRDEIDRAASFVVPAIPEWTAASCARNTLDVGRDDEHVGVARLVVLAAGDALEGKRA